MGGQGREVERIMQKQSGRHGGGVKPPGRADHFKYRRCQDVMFNRAILRLLQQDCRLFVRETLRGGDFNNNPVIAGLHRMPMCLDRDLQSFCGQFMMLAILQNRNSCTSGDRYEKKVKGGGRGLLAALVQPLICVYGEAFEMCIHLFAAWKINFYGTHIYFLLPLPGVFAV